MCPINYFFKLSVTKLNKDIRIYALWLFFPHLLNLEFSFPEIHFLSFLRQKQFY